MIMNKTAQNLTWNCLPLEVKKEVKRQYQIAINAKEYYTECTLEYLFGIHNLTSDAEGEEMLCVSRKKVQGLYDLVYEIYADGTKEWYQGYMKAMQDLFGSKCLPDEGQFAKSAKCLDPKPTEPTCTADCPSPRPSQHFDDIINRSFADHNRLHIAAMLAAGMLANEVRCYPVDRALELADQLIAACEKGGQDA